MIIILKRLPMSANKSNFRLERRCRNNSLGILKGDGIRRTLLLKGSFIKETIGVFYQ